MTQDDIIKNPLDYDLSIETVGKGTLKSPMNGVPFVSENDKVSLTTDVNLISEYLAKGIPVPSLEVAGPRQTIFHDPAWTRAGIVTCGGLCPGLNNVIKGLVQVLWFDYGVRNIFGIPYGYRGLNPNYGYSPIVLDPDVVDAIQEDGGTILGSSRGMQDPAIMVDTLMRLNINVLFCIGGDGTLRGAHAIAEEVKKRKQPISIIGIPKTIDNDLNLIDRTFGFETAVLSATDVITSAHIEANGAFNGLGLVKLMGRDSGFIAAYASLATTVVNICLVPEVPFTLDGLFKALESRYASGKTHAVIAVAEGAGQELFKNQEERRDASGNILKNDIGEFLTHKIKEHFDSVGKEINIKYFDPSYRHGRQDGHGRWQHEQRILARAYRIRRQRTQENQPQWPPVACRSRYHTPAGLFLRQGQTQQVILLLIYHHAQKRRKSHHPYRTHGIPQSLVQDIPRH